MNRMSKLLVLCAVAAMIPAAVSAQTSRVAGLAVQGDYIKDYTGIYTYLSGVPNVGNLVYGELGSDLASTDDRAVGTVLGNLFDGRFGTWGIHLRQQTPNLGQGDGSSSGAPGIGTDPNFHTNESFDLMWGRKFGTSSLGLRLNRSFHGMEFDNGILGTGTLGTVEYDYQGGPINDPAAANLQRNIWGFGAGFGMELSPTSQVELSVLYQTRTFEISDTLGATSEEDGPTTYQLAARAFWQWQPNVVVVPVVKWYSFDLSTADPVAGTDDNSLKGWQLGLAGNWTLGSNDLFVLGVAFGGNTVEQEATVLGIPSPVGTISAVGEIRESYMPLVFAALETHVNNWLTLRFGANKMAWHHGEVEDAALPGTFEFSNSPFNMSIGAGVKIGTLQLDAVVNDDFPRNGFYLFSGAVTSSLFPKVSATYSF